MPPNPLISVVVPTYNRREHLAAAIRTLLAQDYEPLEIVAVNNNCTDGSGEFLDELAAADSRLRHVQEPVQGLQPARNRGLSEARGDIVAYFDDDELAPTQWLSRLWECYEATGADGVGGPYRSLWEGQPDPWLRNSECFKETLGVCTWARQRQPIEWLVGGNCSYRREALEAMSGFGSYVGYTGRKSLSDGADVAVGTKMTLAGYQLYFEPEAYVFHKILRARQKLVRVLRGAFWSGYANAMNGATYDLKQKVACARKRGFDSYVLGLFIVPGYAYGRLVTSLAGRSSTAPVSA